MKALPINYHIEIYESTFQDDPSISLESTTPFPTISVGDFFEHRTDDRWHEAPEKGCRFKVKEIEHIFWLISDSHIGHKLMVCLETVQCDKA